MALGPQPRQKPRPTASVSVYLSPSGHVFKKAWQTMIKTYIVTWLLCFFLPGFDRFIPGYDRFIPGFDRVIPASIPVTGTPPPPPPYNPNAYKSIRCVLFCTLKSFYCVLFEVFFYLKKNINSHNLFPEKYSWGWPRLLSMPQAVNCDPRAVTGISQVL